MDDQARRTLELYLQRPAPQNEEEATVQAYQDWAATELYFRIADRPFEDPERVIIDFSIEMLFYSRSVSSRIQDPNPFKVAYETAQEIILSMEHPREEDIFETD